MSVHINVEYKDDDVHGRSNRLRTILCSAVHSGRNHGTTWNPLVETNFNEVLKNALQDAFDAGRQFERTTGKHLKT
jgi:hypothetical protein